MVFATPFALESPLNTGSNSIAAGKDELHGSQSFGSSSVVMPRGLPSPFGGDSEVQTGASVHSYGSASIEMPRGLPSPFGLDSGVQTNPSIVSQYSQRTASVNTGEAPTTPITYATLISMYPQHSALNKAQAVYPFLFQRLNMQSAILRGMGLNISESFAVHC